jgi:paraquat-inducible protein A
MHASTESVPLNPVRPPPRNENIACPDCGLKQQLPDLEAGRVAQCRRCERPLARPVVAGLDASLALMSAALVLWFPACVATLMTVSATGATRTSALGTGAYALWSTGFPSLAIVVALFSMIVPWAYLVLMIAILSAVRTRHAHADESGAAAGAPLLGVLFRWGGELRPWMMMEVYLVGCCVAYSRIQSVATVEVGMAGWCLIAATLLLLLGLAELDPRTVWRLLPAPAASAPPNTNLIGCTTCDLLAPERPGAHCGRCGARLRARKPYAIERTGALLACGFLLYIPANLLPVLTIERYGQSESNTIMGGVFELLHNGLWPLALIVFGASIVIPLAKLCGLTWMLFLTRRGSAHALVARTRLYRAIDVVGRWSNIDVFMISILLALVQFGALTQVRAESGAVAFAAVVVVTMIGAKTFDTRLMWDAAGAPS